MDSSPIQTNQTQWECLNWPQDHYHDTHSRRNFKRLDPHYSSLSVMVGMGKVKDKGWREGQHISEEGESVMEDMTCLYYLTSSNFFQSPPPLTYFFSSKMLTERERWGWRGWTLGSYPRRQGGQTAACTTTELFQWNLVQGFTFPSNEHSVPLGRSVRVLQVKTVKFRCLHQLVRFHGLQMCLFSEDFKCCTTWFVSPAAVVLSVS